MALIHSSQGPHLRRPQSREDTDDQRVQQDRNEIRLYDSGHHVSCMVEDCGGLAAVMWVDTFNPWLVVLCAEHGRVRLPDHAVIANPVFFDDCPADLRQIAEVRSLELISRPAPTR